MEASKGKEDAGREECRDGKRRNKISGNEGVKEETL